MAMKEILKLSFSFLFIACAHATAQTATEPQPQTPPPAQSPAPSPAPSPEPSPTPSPTPKPTPPVGIAQLNPTIYYKPTIYLDKTTCNNEIIDMISPEGAILISLCGRDHRNCLMQGACFVFDEDGRFRSFNYYARGADNVPRFKEVNLNKCPFGFGVRNNCLDPYYTVAADLSIYKSGDVIFVPKVVGAALPTGETHDGFFIVRDRGAAIVGPYRFDFFTGFEGIRDMTNILARMGFGNKKNTFDFRMATEEEAKMVRERQGYPGVKRTVVLPPHGPSLPPSKGPGQGQGQTQNPPAQQQPTPQPSPTPSPSPVPAVEVKN